MQIIIESKKKHLRRCTNQNDAIVFLHQDIKFSPNMIQNLLRLFDVKLSIPNILETSYKAFAERPQPKWLQGIGSG
ncbi:MAG TPA: hypothetical protein VKA95_09130 [Nitrososphaeraceae archaeon]|nr:hypothetical protein [Nitrososphaeraceae archaeon]